MLKRLKELFASGESKSESAQTSDAPPNDLVSSDLFSWWMLEFSDAERKHILKKYQPLVMGMGVGGDSDSDGNKVIDSDGKPKIKLTTLATWFISPKDDLPIAMRLLKKGVELGEDKHGSTLDQHFTLGNMIKVYYRNRQNDSESLARAAEACEKQIALAPFAADMFKLEEWFENLPAHLGFQQLAIIREKEGNVDEAIRLSSKALVQGWSGDWEKRIARCKRKRERSD